MDNNHYRAELRKAIEKTISRLHREPSTQRKTHLFLTKKQYESDPDGWHEMLRQHGLPDSAIVIVPDFKK